MNASISGFRRPTGFEKNTKNLGYLLLKGWGTMSTISTQVGRLPACSIADEYKLLHEVGL